MPTTYWAFPPQTFTAWDANGDPVPGAKANIFEAGTSTPLTTYTDTALTTPHAVPQIADANGVFAPMYISGPDEIKIDVTDTDDVQLPGYPIDNITGTPIGGLTASGVVFDPTATLAETDVQGALEALDALTDALDPIQPLDATLTSLAAVAGVAGDILYASGADAWARLAKDTDGMFLKQVSGLPAWADDAFSGRLLHVRDEKTSGTHGGTHTSGSYQVRVINTVVTNEISGASLAANRITLPAGDYFTITRVPHYNTAGGNHKGKLENFTDSTDLVIGSSVTMGTSTDSTTHSWIIGRFTLAATKDLEVTHQTSTTMATIGLGGASSFGEVEVYAEVLIWKV